MAHRIPDPADADRSDRRMAVPDPGRSRRQAEREECGNIRYRDGCRTGRRARRIPDHREERRRAGGEAAVCIGRKAPNRRAYPALTHPVRLHTVYRRPEHLHSVRQGLRFVHKQHPGRPIARFGRFLRWYLRCFQWHFPCRSRWRRFPRRSFDGR